MGHPSEEVIELYALGRLAEDLVPSFEEHLLICRLCQEALQMEDAFSQSMTESLRRNRSGIRLV
jgi:hypothetical protein